MIDLLSERTFPLSELPDHLPPRFRKAADGRRVKRKLSKAATYRWASAGLRASDGRVVKLETIRLGGCLHTSLAACARWAEALGGHAAAASAPALRSPSRRTRDLARVDRELDRAGVR